MSDAIERYASALQRALPAGDGWVMTSSSLVPDVPDAPLFMCDVRGALLLLPGDGVKPGQFRTWMEALVKLAKALPTPKMPTNPISWNMLLVVLVFEDEFPADMRTFIGNDRRPLTPQRFIQGGWVALQSGEASFRTNRTPFEADLLAAVQQAAGEAAGEGGGAAAPRRPPTPGPARPAPPGPPDLSRRAPGGPPDLSRGRAAEGPPDLSRGRAAAAPPDLSRGRPAGPPELSRRAPGPPELSRGPSGGVPGRAITPPEPARGRLDLNRQPPRQREPEPPEPTWEDDDDEAEDDRAPSSSFQPPRSAGPPDLSRGRPPGPPSLSRGPSGPPDLSRPRSIEPPSLFRGRGAEPPAPADDDDDDDARPEEESFDPPRRGGALELSRGGGPPDLSRGRSAGPPDLSRGRGADLSRGGPPDLSRGRGAGPPDLARGRGDGPPDLSRGRGGGPPDLSRGAAPPDLSRGRGGGPPDLSRGRSAAPQGRGGYDDDFDRDEVDAHDEDLGRDDHEEAYEAPRGRGAFAEPRRGTPPGRRPSAFDAHDDDDEEEEDDEARSPMRETVRVRRDEQGRVIPPPRGRPPVTRDPDEEAYDYKPAPLSEETEMRRLAAVLATTAPLGTALIILTCCAVFGWTWYLGGSLYQLIRYGAQENALVLGGDWWRLYTATFIHFGMVHIAINMFSLINIGPVLEKFYGNITYLALYSVSGLAGSAAMLYFGGNTISGGASGALFGLCGALVVMGLRYRSEIPARVRASMTVGMLPVLGYNLAFGFLGNSFAHEAGVNIRIGNAAHLGGLIAGMLFAVIVPSPKMRPSGFTKMLMPLLLLLGLAPFAAEGYMLYTHTQSSALVTSNDPSGYSFSRPAALVTLKDKGPNIFYGDGFSLVVRQDAAGRAMGSVDAERANLLKELQSTGMSVTRNDVLQAGTHRWLIADGVAADGANERRAVTIDGRSKYTVILIQYLPSSEATRAMQTVLDSFVTSGGQSSRRRRTPSASSSPSDEGSPQSASSGSAGEPSRAPVEASGTPAEASATPLRPSAAPLAPSTAPLAPSAAPVKASGAAVEPSAEPVRASSAPPSPVAASSAPAPTPAKPSGPGTPLNGDVEPPMGE